MKVMIIHEGYLENGLKNYEIQEVEEISLAFMQNTVKGFIEHVALPIDLEEQKIDLWVNEEGKLLRLNPNVVIANKDNEVLDILVGPILVTSSYEDEVVGLTDEQILSVVNYLGLNNLPKYCDDNNNPLTILRVD